MNKNMLIGIIVVVLVLAGGSLIVKNKSGSQPISVKEQNLKQSEDTGSVIENETELDEDQESVPEKSEDEVLDEKSATNVKSFNVIGANFSFDIKEIKVKVGDKVKINFTSSQGNHDWILDEFNAKSKTIGDGQTDTIEFVASKKGTFEYYCSVGQHRKNGMVGKLIVE